MKTRILLASFLAMSACSSQQETQTLQSAAQIANTAGVAYQTYAAAQSGSLTAGQVSMALQTASNDLSGIATLAQAYVGSGQTPTTAKIQQGAGNLATAAQIVAKLPNTPITQTTANQLFQAASLVTATAPATTQASSPPFPRMDRWPQRAEDSWYNFAPPMQHLTFAANPEVITIRP